MTRWEGEAGRACATDLAVLGSVHGRLGEEEIMLLRVASQIFVDATLPVPLHVVPVLHDAVPDRVVDGWKRR